MTALRNAEPEQVSHRDPAEGRWSQSEMLAATLVDEVRYLRHDYITAHTDKKSQRRRPPQPIPRPGITPAKPKLTAPQAEFLYRHINGLPQDPDVTVTVRPGRGGG